MVVSVINFEEWIDVPQSTYLHLVIMFLPSYLKCYLIQNNHICFILQFDWENIIEARILKNASYILLS